uniref:Uncharacterized protein n=1 Tax=Noctiluca scintillans TaxID=2966 RepID=A0A7S0ZPW8_NOCSC|mmetsp:Transcript_13760/g.37662  ORF Transcript_13760/g.37662 Transcript_13760/m.37662 type:complete len:515 (+) Transcript_13760:114-1658(+)
MGGDTVCKDVLAKAEVDRGSNFHKRGKVLEAVSCYEKALQYLDVCETKVIPLVRRSEVVAEALHLLAAARTQLLQKNYGGAEEDDEIDDSCDRGQRVPCSISPSEQAVVQHSVAMMKAALECLPGGADEKRARIMHSTGVALILLGADSSKEALDNFRRSVQLLPNWWSARVNLCKAIRRRAKCAPMDEQRKLDEEAVCCMREMASQRPDEPRAFYRLGMALKSVGKTSEAIEALETHVSKTELLGLEATGKLPHTRHWLAVLKGETTTTAPPEYVSELFDYYAEKFEHHLVEKLHYNTPSLLMEDLACVDLSAVHRCADLGCGTGLMGPPLRAHGLRGLLEGVDLSEGMLLQCHKKGGRGVGYDRLLCGDVADIFTHLPTEPSMEEPVPVERPERNPEREKRGSSEASFFQLVVAADVFVYIGDLLPVVRIVSQWLAVQGVFAFSTECVHQSGPFEYRITETGRYVHNPDFIRQLCEGEGLEFVSVRPVVLRMNGGKPVTGHIHVMRKLCEQS